MDNNSVKENICHARKKNRITQTEMAERLGISRNSYRRIESGDTVLVNGHIRQIADLLHTTEEELILGFKPVEDSGKLDEMRIKYADKIKDMESGYETEIRALKNTIASLEEHIRLLEDLVRTKDEIINMLKGSNQG